MRRRTLIRRAATAWPWRSRPAAQAWPTPCGLAPGPSHIAVATPARTSITPFVRTDATRDLGHPGGPAVSSGRACVKDCVCGLGRISWQPTTQAELSTTAYAPCPSMQRLIANDLTQQVMRQHAHVLRTTGLCGSGAPDESRDAGGAIPPWQRSLGRWEDGWQSCRVSKKRQ